MIELKKLVEAGVHFGHQKTRWCPKMKPFIWGHKKGIHLIDVSKTAASLEKAANFLKELTEHGKSILWVGTKPAAKDIIQSVAINLNQPYVNNRWVGGMLTNYSQVKKSVTKYLHFQDILAKSEDSFYTKKEKNLISKAIDRLNKTVGGIIKLTWPVGAIVVVDIKRESTAIKEALQSGVPVVALVDTNCDPSGINYVIPGNDDSPRSIKLIIDYLADAVAEGKKNLKTSAPVIEEVEEVEFIPELAGVDEDEGSQDKVTKIKKAVSEDSEKKKIIRKKPAPKIKK